MDIGDILGALGGVGRPAVLERFGADSCIVSTAVVVDVLSHFGKRCEPLAVGMEVWNPKAVEDLCAGDEEVGRKEGHYVLATRKVSPPGYFPGHLIALVENKILYDLSIDQLSRPDKGIVLRPGGFEPDNLKAFLRKKEKAAALVNGCAVMYKRIDDDSWKEAPDWKIVSRRAQISARVIASVLTPADSRDAGSG